MPTSMTYVVLLGALTAVGHGQFLHATFSGMHSFGPSFSESWSFSSSQDGHVTKQFQSTEIRDGHVQKQVQSTEIVRGGNGMRRKDIKIVCHDGRCEEVVEEVMKPMHFLAPYPSKELDREAALQARMNALLQHVFGHGAPSEIIVAAPSHATIQVPCMATQKAWRPNPSPVAYINPTRMVERPQPFGGWQTVTPYMKIIKVATVVCALIFLLVIVLMVTECRKADVSARERAVQGLAEPLAPDDELESGVLAQKVETCDVASVKASVAKYLPHLYEIAKVKAAVSIYLPRVYARAAA